MYVQVTGGVVGFLVHRVPGDLRQAHPAVCHELCPYSPPQTLLQCMGSLLAQKPSRRSSVRWEIALCFILLPPEVAVCFSHKALPVPGLSLWDWGRARAEEWTPCCTQTRSVHPWDEGLTYVGPSSLKTGSSDKQTSGGLNREPHIHVHSQLRLQ